MRTHRFCKHCGTQVRKETNLDYPFYCPRCNENMYRSETLSKSEIKKCSQKEPKYEISQGVERLYSHDIEWWLDGEELTFSEVDEEHICSLLKENFVAGELCSTTPDRDEVYGWWNIKRY